MAPTPLVYVVRVSLRDDGTAQKEVLRLPVLAAGRRRVLCRDCGRRVAFDVLDCFADEAAARAAADARAGRLAGDLRRAAADLDGPARLIDRVPEDPP
jgi:hypothetical protein